MSRELKNKPGLEAVIKSNYSLALEAYSKIEDENDFREVLEPPQILGENFSRDNISIYSNELTYSPSVVWIKTKTY